MDSCGPELLLLLRTCNSSTSSKRKGLSLPRCLPRSKHSRLPWTCRRSNDLGELLCSDGSQRHCPIRGERSHVMTCCFCTKFQNQTPNPPPPTKEGFGPRKLMPAAKYWKVLLPSYQATWILRISQLHLFNLWTQEILQKELVKSQSLQLCECLSGKALRKVTRDVLAESPGEVKRMKQKTHCLRRETKGGLLSYFPCCNWDERGSSNLVASTWHQNRLRWLLCSHNDTRHTPTVHGLWSPKVFS